MRPGEMTSRPWWKLNHIECFTRLTLLLTLLALDLVMVIEPVDGTLKFQPVQRTSIQLSVTDILTPSSTLLSPNGVFALGFFKSSAYPGTFGLGTWYNPLPASEQAVVWMPQRGLMLSDKAYLQVPPGGVLQLIDPVNSTSQPVWISGNSSPGTVLKLRNDGNLVLLDAASSIIWQSFDSPTDTLLPGQALHATANQSLVSWQGTDDWTGGYYFCGWLSSNPIPSLSLYWNGQSILEWNRSSWTSNHSISNRATVYPYLIDYPGSDKIYFAPNGSLFAGTESTGSFSTVMSSNLNTQDILRRVTLDRDGVLRSYSWTNGNPDNAWAVESIWPNQPCAVFAECGPYGICSPAASQVYLRTCTCSDGFEYIDPNDHSKGCKHKVEIPVDVCAKNTTKLTMTRVVGYTDFPYASRLNLFQNVTDESWCRNQCLIDCRCAGAVFWRGGGRCYIKSNPLFNGGFSQDPSGDVGNHSSYLKVSLERPSTDRGKPYGIIGTSVAAGAAFVCLGAVLFVWKYWEQHRKQLRSTKSNVEFAGHLMCPRKFTLRELRAATSNFSQSELIGCGGMGSVYKGTLTKDKAIVAVKRIRHETRGSEQGFLAEASSISQIRHRNLVQLKGWCIEDGKFLLVYDYMPNGSLDQWLYDDKRNDQRIEKELSWSLRFSILTDITAALQYLHEDWQQCVLHRDIKSGNVLLDAEFNAHLSDFGLARLIDHQKMEKTTMMAGTFGYMAPEMPYTGRATKETDVYSFGVLMLEVACGRKPMDSFSDLENHENDIILLHRVQRAHEEGKLLSVVDPRLQLTTQRARNGDAINGKSTQKAEHDAEANFSGALTRRIEEVRDLEDNQKMLVLKLGLLCCLPIPSARPSIRLVRQILIGDVTTIPALPDMAQLTHLDVLNAVRSESHPRPLQESRSFSTSTSTTFHPEVRE